MEQKYKYMVCTRCFTFNHAPYIVDAMNGFAMQETTFPVVTLIVDDASTDGEQVVIRQYLSEHFQEPYRTEETEYAQIICAHHKTNSNCEFVVFLLKYNHYSIKKTKFPYLSEWLDNAKYIALCEGDDYWIHPKKLQMQISIMESEEGIGLVYGKVRRYFMHNEKFEGVLGEKCSGIEDLIVHNTIPTLSVVYKAKHLIGFSEVKRKNWLMGDYPLWLYIAGKSNLRFIDEVIGCYRILSESASHSKSYSKMVTFLESSYDIQKYFSNIFGLDMIEMINKHYNQKRFDLAYSYNKEEDIISTFPLVEKSFKNLSKYIIIILRIRKLLNKNYIILTLT